MTPEDGWFQNALDLEQRGESAAALDVVFDHIDDWLCAGQFDECNAFLGRLDVSSLSVRMILGVLTITFAADKHLPNRGPVCDRAWTVVESHGRNPERLIGRLRNWKPMTA